MSRTSVGPNGPTSSSVRAQASTIGFGNKLGDEAMSWPSFTKVGPRTSNPSTMPTDTASVNGRLRRRTTQPTAARTTAVKSTKLMTNVRRTSARPNRSSGGACTSNASGGGPSA